MAAASVVSAFMLFFAMDIRATPGEAAIRPTIGGALPSQADVGTAPPALIAGDVPQLPHLHAALAVQRAQTRHVGGLIRSIDSAHARIVIYSKTHNLTYTIEVIQATKITLSKWASGFADMIPGDHLTVSGISDTANNAIGPNPIIARTIKISSPTFGGTIAVITPAAGNAVILTVRARRGHMLHIDVSGQTPVLYGTQTAHARDLFVGAKIAAHGTRVDKFELQASSIKVYPRLHTVGGAIVGVQSGLIRLASSSDGSTIIVQTDANTRYFTNGKAATAAAVKVGLHARVYGSDALPGAQKNVTTIIARSVSLIIRQSAHPTKKAASPPHKKTAHP
jgi:hypothetical protein